METSHFFVRVAGTAYPNDDGSSRQEAIEHCRPREQVFLRPEPENPYDSNATAVDRQNDEQLGYLPRELAAEVQQYERLGYQHVAFVWFILQPEPDFPFLGTELVVIRAGADIAPEKIQEYINHSIE
jgi:hypothetical protein